MLIKPQFEAGRERIGKKGIVSDPKVHEDVLVDILSFSEQIGFTVEKVTYSPITGGSGNIEFLAHLKIRHQVRFIHLKNSRVRRLKKRND